jgi:KDO2-lipid IV(A) lauroyltransferase
VRGRFIKRQIHHAEVRTILRALANNEIVQHGPDQAPKHGAGIQARFFGQPVQSNTATAKLARISGAAVVPYHPVRLPDGTFELRLEPPLAEFPGEDLAAATQRVNDTIEAHIRAEPGQYLWSHRRFKPARKGDPSPYR